MKCVCVCELGKRRKCSFSQMEVVTFKLSGSKLRIKKKKKGILRILISFLPWDGDWRKV